MPRAREDHRRADQVITTCGTDFDGIAQSVRDSGFDNAVMLTVCQRPRLSDLVHGMHHVQP